MDRITHTQEGHQEGIELEPHLPQPHQQCQR
jgi:hypothetical protein